MTTTAAVEQPSPRPQPPQRAEPLALFLLGIVAMVVTGIAATRGILAGAVVVAATGAAIYVLRHPIAGAYVLVAAVPVLSGIRRGFPVPGLRLAEVLVVGLAALVLLAVANRRSSRWHAVDWAALAYAVASIVIPIAHLVARQQPFDIRVISSLLLPLQFFLLYRAVRVGLEEQHQRVQALRLLLLGSVMVSLIAVVQQLDLGPSREVVKAITAAEALDSYGYSVYARATGPFQHWHPLAGYLTVTVLLAVSLVLHRRFDVFSQRALAAILLLSTAALMLSVTFTSMLAVVAGVLVLGAWSGHLQQTLKWCAAGAVAASVLFGSYVVTRIRNQYAQENGITRSSWVPQTIEMRVNVWRDQYLPGLDGRWATGWGAGLPPDVQWQHTESIYITLLLRGGLPLLVLFAVSMVAVARLARRIAVRPGRAAEARTVVVLVGILWFMHLLFPYFTASGMPQVFWALVGITVAGWQTGATAERAVEMGTAK